MIHGLVKTWMCIRVSMTQLSMLTGMSRKRNYKDSVIGYAVASDIQDYSSMIIGNNKYCT